MLSIWTSQKFCCLVTIVKTTVNSESRMSTVTTTIINLHYGVEIGQARDQTSDLLF